MLKKIILVLTLLFFVSALAIAGDTDKKEKSCCSSEKTDVDTVQVNQTTCPVMGGEINKEIFVDYQGKRVYFCCQACVEKFNKDADTYIQKLSGAGVTLEKAPCAGNCQGDCCKDKSTDNKGGCCSTKTKTTEP